MYVFEMMCVCCLFVCVPCYEVVVDVNVCVVLVCHLLVRLIIVWLVYLLMRLRCICGLVDVLAFSNYELFVYCVVCVCV